MVPRNSSKASPISSIDVVLKHHLTVLRTDVLFPSVPFFMRLQGTYDSVQSFWELRGGGGEQVDFRTASATRNEQPGQLG